MMQVLQISSFSVLWQPNKANRIMDFKRTDTENKAEGNISAIIPWNNYNFSTVLQY